MKGLLKAYLDEALNVPTDRVNKPDRLGVTLLWNAGQFDPHEVEDVVQRLNGKTISVDALAWFKGPSTDFVLVGLPEEIREVAGNFYPYPFHITLGWDSDSAPCKAASESNSAPLNCANGGAISFSRKATIEFQEFAE